MELIKEELALWRSALVSSIPVAGLLSRNAIVYKWKAPFRSWLLRETVFWRTCDLLEQAHLLHCHGHELGSRIIIRSALESVATLIYLNQITGDVLDGVLDFADFDARTATLLLSSRDDKTSYRSINILSVLEKCKKRYPALKNIYAELSESAHPSCQGLCVGYSKVDREEYETNLSNRWNLLFGNLHDGLIRLCM